jgi:hypothetical protein
MSKFLFVHWIVLLLSSIFPFVFSSRPWSDLLERPWSEKCLTLGDDVTNYLLGVLFRVTLLLHLLALGLFFITPWILAWACVGVALGVYGL